MLAFASCHLLAFAPSATRLVPPHSSTRLARSRPMVAPMDFVTDLPLLEVMLPATLHPVLDQALRGCVYSGRLIAGATGFDGALAGADMVADLRMLLTASTVGTVRSAQGLGSALSAGSLLPGIQHASMLLHHPIMLGKWASQFFTSAATASSIAVSGRSVCAVLWLAFIAAFALLNLKQLRGSVGAERRTILLTLRKLVCDVPLATHFMMGASLLPLALVGLLGGASSVLGIRAALANPSNLPTPRLTLPLPRWSMRRVAAAGPACAGNALAGDPRPSLVSCASAAATHCTRQRRRIGGGPLSSSCEW